MAKQLDAQEKFFCVLSWAPLKVKETQDPPNTCFQGHLSVVFVVISPCAASEVKLTRSVYGHHNRPVLQGHSLPLPELGCCATGAQQQPQGGRHHRGVVERQIVAEVPLQVVP